MTTSPPTSAARHPLPAGIALPYSWDTEFGLLTDRFVLYDGVKLVAWTYLLVAVLFSAVFLVRGESEAIPALLSAFAFALAGLSLLGVLIMLVVFRNRVRAKVTISTHGILVESTSGAGKAANRLAIIAGALARSPATLGAGLLGRAGESVALEWSALRRVNAHDDHCVLSLMNRWRVVSRLYCTPENYATVSAIVAAHGPQPGRSS
jgi:hypothetical protein